MLILIQSAESGAVLWTRYNIYFFIENQPF